jgi:hypothetical protein
MTAKRKPMPVQRLDWAMAQPVSQGARHVLIALVSFVLMDHVKTTCWPSQQELATKTGFSVRSVAIHLQSLEDAGCITRVPRYDKNRTGKRRSNKYVLLGLPTALQADSAGSGPAALQADSAGSDDLTPRSPVTGVPSDLQLRSGTTGRIRSGLEADSVVTTGRFCPENQPIEPTHRNQPTYKRSASDAAERDEDHDDDITCRQSSHDERTVQECTDQLNDFLDRQGLGPDSVTATQVHNWLHLTDRPVVHPRGFVARQIENLYPTQLLNWIATAALDDPVCLKCGWPVTEGRELCSDCLEDEAPPERIIPGRS